MEARAISEGSVTKLVPGASHSLAHLSDNELLTNTQCLAGKSNQVFAALLLHLAEVEARGVHRTRRCSSLYTYCIYELRFSEDAASRRASAARLVKRFPALLDAIAAGELHLTGLLMLGTHLTESNHLEVMAHAKFRTKKEIAKLVRMRGTAAAGARPHRAARTGAPEATSRPASASCIFKPCGCS